MGNRFSAGLWRRGTICVAKRLFATEKWRKGLNFKKRLSRRQATEP